MRRLARGAVVLFLVLVCRFALSTESVTGRFNLDDQKDTLTFTGPDEHGIVTIEISLATVDGKEERVARRYKVLESHVAIFSRKVGEITVVDGGDVAGAIKYFRTYSYNRRMKDWFLTKDIGYSRQGRVEPSDIEVGYSDGTQGLDEATKIAKSQAEIEAPEARRVRLSKDLSALHDNLSALYKAHKLSKMPASAHDELLLAEMIHNIPVTEQTAEIYNNIGFFLSEDKSEKQEALVTALYVLKKVVTATPKRTAAYLNLADVYFRIGSLGQAKTAYAAYVEQMTAQGKEKRRSQRRLTRAKMESGD